MEVKSEMSTTAAPPKIIAKEVMDDDAASALMALATTTEKKGGNEDPPIKEDAADVPRQPSADLRPSLESSPPSLVPKPKNERSQSSMKFPSKVRLIDITLTLYFRKVCYLLL